MMTSHTLDYLTDRAPGQGRRLPARARVDSDAAELDLNGDWKFRLLPQAPGSPVAADMLPPGELDEGVGSESYDDGDWDTIAVPGHWVLEADGRYGRPTYTNIQFPFPIDVPNVPDDNPTATTAAPSTFRTISRRRRCSCASTAWSLGTRCG